MDSERRHELETNDLKDFLDNFKDFWEKHGNKVLILLILVLLVYAGPKYYSNWQTGKANEANDALLGATTPDTLLAVADEHQGVRDEATRRAADLLFEQARTASIAGEAEAAGKALDRAHAAYTALAQRGRTDLFQINGHEGLAKVATAKGEPDAAAGHYNALIELAGETYTAQAARARKAIENQDLLANPVAFAEPKPEPVEQILPLPGDAGSGNGGFEPVLPGLNLPDLAPVPGPAPADKTPASNDSP